MPEEAHTAQIRRLDAMIERSKRFPSIPEIAVIRKNYGNDVLPEANYAVLGRRCYSVREYLRVDKL